MSEIYKLYGEWSMILQGSETPGGKMQLQQFEPLIKMLEGMISPSSGKGGGKGKLGFERAPIDVKAFDLYSEIKDITEVGLHELQRSATSDLALNVQSLEARVGELWTSGGIEQHRYHYYVEKMEGWVTRIWNLIDPPREAELKYACPFCGENDWFDQEGAKSTALLLRHRDGKEPEVTCRRCRDGYWVGANQLINLGRMLGADMDEQFLLDSGIG